ncbi:hypothetical protein BDV12DRAFT_200858 [Aspergillus spectabilis]
MLSIYQLLALGTVVVLGYVLSQRNGQDSREPPAVGSKIPFIGHLVGMLQHGVEYFNILTAKYQFYPIFCVDMLFTKVYLVTSPTLLQAIQRKKSLTFDPFLTFTADRIAGIHGPALELLREKQTGGQGGNQAIVHAMHPTLTGSSLDHMNERMSRLLTPLVDELSQCETIDLYAWCTHAITKASTDASYGPLNPYKDREVEDAFWALENNLCPLLANFLPRLIARKAWQGRKKAVAAFIEYYSHNGHTQASELTRARYKAMHEAGLSLTDIARHEASMGLGLLSNTVPATFWVLYDLYSRPGLLNEIREEVKQKAIRFTMEKKHIISIPALRDTCPLLVSTYQEILRNRSTSSPTRFATEDLLLADKYLIKKGSVISVPGRSMSRNDNVWGAQAEQFDPRRFIKTSEHNPRRTGGFMAFGVSPVICPGRHFASSEILSIVAMVIMRVDLSPEGGVWREPRANSLAIASIMGPIKGEYRVKVTLRGEYEGVKWDCEAKEGAGVFNLMIG